MTVIIGVEHNGNVFMGADSECVNGWMRHQLTTRKIARLGELLIGVAGQIRTHNIILYQFVPPERLLDESDEHYVIVSVIEAIRKCLKDSGWLTVENSKETVDLNEFLIGYRAKLYRVGPHFDVAHYRSGIASVGSGDQYALGAMYALRASRKRAYSEAQIETQIKTALRISAQLSMGVSEPFYVESI